MGSEQLIMGKSGQKHGKKCSQTGKDCSSGVVHEIPSQRMTRAISDETAIAIGFLSALREQLSLI